MRLVSVLALTLGFVTLTISSISSANTQIRFAKGSYCGIWSGGFRGDSKTFDIYLRANQEVSIEVFNGSFLSSFSGPSGSLHAYSESNGVEYFNTRRGGKHRITVTYMHPRYADNYSGSFASVQVCAY